MRCSPHIDISMNPTRYSGWVTYFSHFTRARLVKVPLLHYCLTMSLNKNFALPVLLFCGLNLASADVIQLKDQAAVTGKILAEKPDSVVLDVGYTVLVVPRNSIASIST